jgi:hypothetical protein
MNFCGGLTFHYSIAPSLHRSSLLFFNLAAAQGDVLDLRTRSRDARLTPTSSRVSPNRRQVKRVEMVASRVEVVTISRSILVCCLQLFVGVSAFSSPRPQYWTIVADERVQRSGPPATHVTREVNARLATSSSSARGKLLMQSR